MHVGWNRTKVSSTTYISSSTSLRNKSDAFRLIRADTSSKLVYNPNRELGGVDRRNMYNPNQELGGVNRRNKYNPDLKSLYYITTEPMSGQNRSL